MQDSFHRNVLGENEKTILFIGGGGKSALIRRLTEDCISLRKKTLLFSLFPQQIPIDSKAVVAGNVKNIHAAIQKELKKSRYVFVGKSYKKMILSPFKASEIQQIISKVEAEHIFIEADTTDGKSISNLNKVPAFRSHEIDRCVVLIGADALNQNFSPVWLDSRDPFWEKNKIISPISLVNWYAVNKTLFRFVERGIPFTYFINKVETIYTRNLALALAKELKKQGIERVLSGSVFDSEFQAIK
jgi:hypothetical protein